MFRYDTKYTYRDAPSTFDFDELINNSSWAESQTGVWFVKDDRLSWLVDAKNRGGQKIGRFDKELKMFFIYDRPVIHSPAECGDADIVFRGYL